MVLNEHCSSHDAHYIMTFSDMLRFPKIVNLIVARVSLAQNRQWLGNVLVVFSRPTVFFFFFFGLFLSVGQFPLIYQSPEWDY